jgi:hypothetical protein
VRRRAGHAGYVRGGRRGKLQIKIITLNLGIYWSLRDRRARTGFLLKSGVQAKGGAAPPSDSEVNTEWVGSNAAMVVC